MSTKTKGHWQSAQLIQSGIKHVVVVVLRDEEVIEVLRLHWQFTMHQFS